MNGFEKLKEQMEGQKDNALQEVVNYLLTRKDMENRYLNEEKSIEGMCDFIKEKGRKNAKNGWNFVSNEIVYAWAIMYYSLPNSLLQIKTQKTNEDKENNKNKSKNNVVSIEKAKETRKQLSLFGGETE